MHDAMTPGRTRGRVSLGLVIAAAVGLQLSLYSGEADAARQAGMPLRNPGMAPNGMAAMHADAGASDTTPHRGPGAGPIAVQARNLKGICPTVVAGADAYPLVVCLAPAVGTTIYLLDPKTSDVLASTTLARPPGRNNMGGAYAYVDAANRLVTVDGHNDLLRIGHRRDASGQWHLIVDERVSLSAALDHACGDPGCNGVNSVAPDWGGRIWFSTHGGTTGFLDTASRKTQTLQLTGEKIANSIATVPQGVAVVTDRALYLLTSERSRRPTVRWRKAYDRGPSHKPGQLSWSSGTTPTFFGPRDSSQFVAIVDNAMPHANLLVHSTRDGRRVCSIPVFPELENSGTEVSVIAVGRQIFVMNTYGYVFPPVDTPATELPAPARFVGGMTRIDLRPDLSGCTQVWTSATPVVAAPRLSLADGLLYAVAQRSPLESVTVSPADSFEFTVIDSRSGTVVSRRPLLWPQVTYPITINMVVNHDGAAYQGTVDGVLRIDRACSGLPLGGCPPAPLP